MARRTEKGIIFYLACILCLTTLISCSTPTGSTVTDDVTGEATQAQTEAVTQPDATEDDNKGSAEVDEMRGVWLASVWNIDFPSRAGLDPDSLKREADTVISTVKEVGLNAIFFQVRPMSDALYKSKIYPTSECLTGKQGKPLTDDFDILEYMVEKSHAEGIQLHAWVNPLRITNGSKAAPKVNLEDLAENNPARLHPEWVVNYANANLVYDAGLPEVRQLVCDGVAEIVENYDVDGIIFDDYFYPYLIDNQPFNDDETYKKYGSGYDNVADFRRDNINKMIKAVYDTVKSKNEKVLFGVGPGGIWQNDNGSNGGSPTKGFESYSGIYCDTLAWVEGGYVDYIAPQIYWAHSSTAAPFLPLATWWNKKMKDSDVKLYFSLATYRASEWDRGEITKQLNNASRLSKYEGSIFYNYSSIANNDAGVKNELKKLYK